MITNFKYMKLIAHRGLSGRWGDNNLVSFQKAIDCGNFHGLEMDIYVDMDDRIVIGHDFMTTSTLYLEDFFNKIKIPDDMKIFLNIKGFDNIVPIIENFFKNKSLEQFVFCSFNLKILDRFKLPVIKGLITSNLLRKTDLERMLDDKTFYILVEWSVLERKFINDCQSLGLRVYTFTPKRQNDLMYVLQYDIQGIILNNELTLLK